MIQLLAAAAADKRQSRRGDESLSRAPSVDDDSEGHLIYKDGDILQARCTQQFIYKNKTKTSIISRVRDSVNKTSVSSVSAEPWLPFVNCLFGEKKKLRVVFICFML